MIFAGPRGNVRYGGLVLVLTLASKVIAVLA
jgi:hypothetical protein